MEVRLEFARKDAWSGLTKYPGCFTGLGSVWTRSGNRYTGLTEEDARRLETAIGYPDGHLAPHSNFWIRFAINIGPDGLILHTENPNDELMYLFAKGHKRVADGSKNLKPQHDFILINQEVEAEQANTINKIKRDAYAEFNKMSLDNMRKCLRLYGVKSDNISAELVESKLFENIDKDPRKFIKLWINNKNRETQFLIEAAIAKNIIRVSRNIYYYGTEVIGRSMEDVIANLDDKKNQDLKLTILEEIESK